MNITECKGVQLILKHKDKLLMGKEILVTILGIGLLAQSIVYFCDGGNALYQTIKNISYAQAIFMLTAFFCVVQRVRLFNWQSLVVSLLYLPAGYAYRNLHINSQDLFNRDKVVVWIAWLLLMLVVDMAVYKKYTPLEKFNKRYLAIFAMMTVAMIFFRHDRNHPFMLILAFLFYLIPMTVRKWRRVVNQFCYGWGVAFVVMLYRSVVNHPEVNAEIGRWYGDFLNIGDFGQFLGCTLVVVVYKLYQIWREKSWKNVELWLWALFCVPLGWAMLKVSTITMFLGAFLMVIAGLIVIRKRTWLRDVLKRLGIAVLIIVILGAMFVGAMKLLAGTDPEYWESVLTNDNVFATAWNSLLGRIYYTFSDVVLVPELELFEPGSMMNALDLFSSGRLTIIKLFSEYFTFTGNQTFGVQVGGYFAFSAHNTYTQMLFEYGYIGGGLFIAWILYSVWTATRQFLREPRISGVLPILWLAMLLGLMMGESIWFYYPALAMTLPLLHPLMVPIERKKAPAAAE